MQEFFKKLDKWDLLDILRPQKWPATKPLAGIGGEIMADKNNKVPENVPGKYYVDTQCIDCNLCRDTSPENFKQNEAGGYAFVAKQPSNDGEGALCKDSKESCPVEAIGDDGE